MPVNYQPNNEAQQFSNFRNFDRIDELKWDIKALQECCDQVLKRWKYPASMEQLCFTHTNKEYPGKNLLYEGCGSLTYQWDKNPYDSKGNLKKRDIQLVDRDFVSFNSEFKNTYLYKVYEDLNTYYHIGRFRLMQLNPKKCLSWHSDTEKRIHIAIKTNLSCRMVIADECAHIPADGHPYLCHTESFHTAFNGSHKLKRLHLVAGIHGTRN